MDRFELDQDISNLSKAWRQAKLPPTNKLHLLEAHLADFLDCHSSWGLFGEQGIESLHHIANMASERCFGKNEQNKMQFFMKRHLLTAICDASEFNVKQRIFKEKSSSETELCLYEEKDVDEQYAYENEEYEGLDFFEDEDFEGIEFYED